MTDDLAFARCKHGHLFLGCPHDDCAEQNTYLDRNQKAIDRYNNDLEQNARDYVRRMMGLDG